MTRRRPAPWTDSDDDSGARPGEDAPRWPNAPEPTYDDDGAVRNAKAECRACGAASTLCYRCSECGADLVSS